MEYAIDCGINIFNAAEIYPVLPKSETQGRAESIISTWLAPEKRDKVLIATKIAGRNTFDCLRRDRSPTRQSRSQIREVVDASLKRPKTDYIDPLSTSLARQVDARFPRPRIRAHDTHPIPQILDALAPAGGQGMFRGLSSEMPWG